MSLNRANISIGEGTQDSAQELEVNLLKALHKIQTQSDNNSYTLVAEDKNNLIGGVVASTSYGWLLVKILWVEEAYQGNGLGTSLMHQVETKAKEDGCHGAWLDTSNPKAMAFYTRLGYEVFGKLSNGDQHYPQNHNRWFMKKMF